MPRKGLALKQYNLRVEMRRLADALYDFIQKHDMTMPTMALSAFREARLLAKLAADCATEGEKAKAAGSALSQLESRLRKQGMLTHKQPIPIELTPECDNGRDE